MGLLEYLNECLRVLGLINQELDVITQKGKDLLMTIQEYRDQLKIADDETTRIAGVILDLLSKLQAGGLTPAEEQEVFDGLKSVAEKLKTVGVVTT